MEQTALLVVRGSYGEIRVTQPEAPARESELEELYAFLIEALLRQADGEPSG
ncbi:hypothetical protein G3578_19030 [Brevibacillus sp. SYP-B805]|uniref:hypothetical protein n=1 Tax=Brevibacillus sp. SYP-B805 TaxID=1578199 RepID=UPI0013EA1E40|nr:hypothetical protein [Brevibacillus sp. SYP-B805]NGQ97235.1 hypothetical protein [Brevibacillus sp. SYP-B805]